MIRYSQATIDEGHNMRGVSKVKRKPLPVSKVTNALDARVYLTGICQGPTQVDKTLPLKISLTPQTTDVHQPTIKMSDTPQPQMSITKSAEHFCRTHSTLDDEQPMEQGHDPGSMATAVGALCAHDRYDPTPSDSRHNQHRHSCTNCSMLVTS